MLNKKIVEKNINDIIPYENNPRHNENAVDAVANSIKEFNFQNPIIIDKDNVIIAGHTRLRAARKLGLEKVPCIVADDLTPEQVKAFRLADNKVGELAGWDFLKLDEELSHLNIDMSAYGFEPVEEVDMDSFFESKEESEEKEEKKKTVVCPHCGEEFEV